MAHPAHTSLGLYDMRHCLCPASHFQSQVWLPSPASPPPPPLPSPLPPRTLDSARLQQHTTLAGWVQLASSPKPTLEPPTNSKVQRRPGFVLASNSFAVAAFAELGAEWAEVARRRPRQANSQEKKKKKTPNVSPGPARSINQPAKPRQTSTYFLAVAVPVAVPVAVAVAA